MHICTQYVDMGIDTEIDTQIDLDIDIDTDEDIGILGSKYRSGGGLTGIGGLA